MSWQQQRGRVAGLKRAIRNGERPADDPELPEALRALGVEVAIERIRKAIASAPQLTDDERSRIVVTILHADTALHEDAAS